MATPLFYDVLHIDMREIPDLSYQGKNELVDKFEVRWGITR